MTLDPPVPLKTRYFHVFLDMRLDDIKFPENAKKSRIMKAGVRNFTLNTKIGKIFAGRFPEIRNFLKSHRPVFFEDFFQREEIHANGDRGGVWTFFGCFLVSKYAIVLTKTNLLRLTQRFLGNLKSLL